MNMSWDTGGLPSPGNKKTAYLCAPYAEDDLHVVSVHQILAQKYAKTATDMGYIVVVPHNMMPWADDAADREKIMQTCLAVVACCDVLIVFGDRLSDGMRAEIDEAKSFRMPVVWIGTGDLANIYTEEE